MQLWRDFGIYGGKCGILIQKSPISLKNPTKPLKNGATSLKNAAFLLKKRAKLLSFVVFFNVFASKLNENEPNFNVFAGFSLNFALLSSNFGPKLRKKRPKIPNFEPKLGKKRAKLRKKTPKLGRNTTKFRKRWLKFRKRSQEVRNFGRGFRAFVLDHGNG